MKNPVAHPLALLTLFLLASGMTGFAVFSSPQQSQPAPAARGIELRNPPAGAPVINKLPEVDNRHALIIGIDQYQSDSGITGLVGAANDAIAFSQALTNYAGFPPGNIQLLTPQGVIPTKANILRALTRLKTQIEPGGLLIFFFAGHGIIDGKGQSFLVGWDGQLVEEILEETSLSLTRVEEGIRQTKAQQVILFLDACRNDPRADKRGLQVAKQDPRLVEAVNAVGTQGPNVQARATIFATAINGSAYEDTVNKRGYFTLALVEGLKGTKTANQKGEVTLGGLIDYLRTEVPRLAQRGNAPAQTPSANITSNYKFDELVIARALVPVPPSPTPLTPPPVATATLFVTAPAQTAVTLTAVGPQAASQVKTVGPGQGGVTFDKLPLGKYQVKGALAGYKGDQKDIELDASAAPPPVNLSLLPLRLGEAYSANPFRAYDWQLGGGWLLTDKSLTFGGIAASTAMLREYQYNELYLESTVELSPGGTVSFLLCADSELKNFYEVRLDGEASARPYELIFSAVRAGQPPQVVREISFAQNRNRKLTLTKPFVFRLRQYANRELRFSLQNVARSLNETPYNEVPLGGFTAPGYFNEGHLGLAAVGRDNQDKVIIRTFYASQKELGQ